MKATLHDVAKRAGVSIATASRALNGLRVTENSGVRVRQAVSDLGYVANEAARALRSERTMTMGLIFFDLRNMLGVELIDGLSEGVEAAGYSLLIASARADTGRYDRLLHRFLERRVDAVFCIDPKGEGETLARYAAAGTPLIALFAAGSAFAQAPLLTPSFAESAQAVAAHLAGLGHRRVALLQDPGGRAKPLIAIGEALRGADAQVETIELSEAGGIRAIVDQLRVAPEPPTAVIALDPKARGLLAACEAEGIATPGDLSVVSVSEIGAERRGRKVISTLVIDPQRMGRAASASMLAWLAGSKPVGRTLVQAGRFEARTTTGVAKPGWNRSGPP